MSYTNPVLEGAPPDAGKPKTNADFRALLARAPPARASDDKTPHRGKTKSAKPRKPRTNDEDEDDDGARYRDRARERRERQDNGDDDNDVLRASAMSRGVFERRGDDVSNAERVEDDFARRKAIEESKYLGGDVERTHLVKGLDFALLRKVQSELEDGEALKRLEQSAREDAGASRAEPTFSSSRARAVFEYVTSSVNKAAHAQGKGRGRHVHEFASGAVSYSFNLSSNGRGGDVPTTTRRATDDDGVAGVRALRAYVDPKRDASLLTRLGKLMHYLTLGSEKAIKKFRREERRAAHEAKEAERRKASAGTKSGDAPVVNDDSDEDIFADAGKDYDPTVAPAPQRDNDKSAKSYFGDDVAGGEASKAAPKAKTIAAEDYVEDEGADDDARANAFGVSGDYDECYPGYDVDVDDVGTFDKKLHREDEDEDAKTARERKESIRKKRAEGNEFSKIRSMMKDKFGGKNDVAFEEKQKPTKTAPAPAQSKRQGDAEKHSEADASSGRHKRLRL